MWLNEFYLIKIGYYTEEMFIHFIFGWKRYDFSEMALHHFLTNVLTITSYSTNNLKIGTSVMFVHDVSDIAVA